MLQTAVWEGITENSDFAKPAGNQTRCLIEVQKHAFYEHDNYLRLFLGNSKTNIVKKDAFISKIAHCRLLQVYSLFYRLNYNFCVILSFDCVI